MESLAKDVWTRRPDTPSEGGGKWVFFIRITYPDMICYRLECDRRECRVLLPEGVRIGKRAVIPPGCITSGILLRRHPPGCITSRILLRRITSEYSHPVLDAGWERRAFQLPRSTISGSSDSTYPQSFAAILHSAAVFS